MTVDRHPIVIMIQAQCQLIEKKQLKKEIFLLRFENAVIASKTKPGQFVHVSLGPGSVLRRPFSVFNTDRDTFDILFQVVGPGTRRLATYRAGQILDVIGSLGHGFPLDTKSPLLVGGGTGAASLNLLYKHFINQKIKPKVLLGFRTADMSIELPDALVATEDGTVGKKGLVTDLLKDELDGTDIIYACGPEAMLKQIDSIAKKNEITAYVCMERFMACGVGACLSCICETKYGLARVCKEGPVFNSRDVIW